MDCVREVKGTSVHVQPLDHIGEGVSRQVKIARNLINDDSALQKATFLVVQSFDCLLKNLIIALPIVVKVSTVLHL